MVSASHQEPVAPSMAVTATVKEAKEKLPADTRVATAEVPIGLPEPNPEILARPKIPTPVAVKVKAKAVPESPQAAQPAVPVKAKSTPILKVKVKVQTKPTTKPVPTPKAKPVVEPKPAHDGKKKSPMVIGFFPAKGPSDYLGLDTAAVPQERRFSTAGAIVVRVAKSKKGGVKKPTLAPVPKPKSTPKNVDVIGPSPASAPVKEKKKKKKSKAIAS